MLICLFLCRGVEAIYETNVGPILFGICGSAQQNNPGLSFEHKNVCSCYFCPVIDERITNFFMHLHCISETFFYYFILSIMIYWPVLELLKKDMCHHECCFILPLTNHKSLLLCRSLPHSILVFVWLGCNIRGSEYSFLLRC